MSQEKPDHTTTNQSTMPGAVPDGYAASQPDVAHIPGDPASAATRESSTKAATSQAHPTNGKTTTRLTRSEQARINGAKSRGPKTPHGKARSAQNVRVKHGFRAEAKRAAGRTQVALQKFESEAVWQQHLDSYVSTFLPINMPEFEAVEQMADARWRRKRIVGVETALLSLAAASNEPKVQDAYFEPDPSLHIAIAWATECGENRSFELTYRYIAAAERSYTRAFYELRALQGDRFMSRPAIVNHPTLPPLHSHEEEKQENEKEKGKEEEGQPEHDQQPQQQPEQQQAEPPEDAPNYNNQNDVNPTIANLPDEPKDTNDSDEQHIDDDYDKLIRLLQERLGRVS
jgi:hypothetical protein